MTFDEMTTKLREADAFIDGKRLKLNFRDMGVVMLDGVARTVGNDDGPADAAITIGWDDWKALAKGQLDPMTAYMKGRLKIEGDMGLAMKLQGLFARLKDEYGQG